MTKGTGECRINGVEVGELRVGFINLPAPVVETTYAFVNAETGSRFGSGKINMGWSEETMNRLHSLLESIEADLCQIVFAGGATSGSGAVMDDTTTDSIPSL